MLPGVTSLPSEGIGEMPGQAEEDVTDEQLAIVYEFLVGLSQTASER